MTRSVRLGCASGFWGDSNEGAHQLVKAGAVHYIVFDYLSEVTMSILAKAKAKDRDAGYAKDFVNPVMASILKDVVAKGIKVVANAGGINPRACRDALLEEAKKQGVADLSVAVVEGDDLTTRAKELRMMGLRDLDSGEPFPNDPWSVSAYLGAWPIARALSEGADIVITGRCVDSALVLGPLVHEFGWGSDEYDKLASGTLAGHIVECGCQATGGNFTDWKQVTGWENMGFPILECDESGAFVVTKPASTGGLVTPLTVAEQIVYELGDPANYIMPDVRCDFTQVKVEQVGTDRVLVSGAVGRPPTSTLKVSATYQDGYRATAIFTLCGIDCFEKAERVADAILTRTRRLFRDKGEKDYRRTSVKLLGTEDQYGPLANRELRKSREIVVRIDVHHNSRSALRIFASEIAPTGTAMAPGRCSLFGGRPEVKPLVRHAAFLIDKAELSQSVVMGDRSLTVSNPPSAESTEAPVLRQTAERPKMYKNPQGIPLIKLACARSGDKGDKANIGVIARQPQILPLLKDRLTADVVAGYFSHLCAGPVVRYEMPGINALNFVMEHALDGGGTSSLRNDPLGKAFAQMLLDIKVDDHGWAEAEER